MFRRLIITVATVAALGISFSSTNASAGGDDWHGGRGWYSGDWYAGGWYEGGSYGGGSYERRWYGCRGLFGCYPVYDFRYVYGPDPFYTECYRTIRIGTPRSPRWRRVWVCD